MCAFQNKSSLPLQYTIKGRTDSFSSSPVQSFRIRLLTSRCIAALTGFYTELELIDVCNKTLKLCQVWKHSSVGEKEGGKKKANLQRTLKIDQVLQEFNYRCLPAASSAWDPRF